MRLRALVLSAALLILPLPLMADTVYTYTGNLYTNFESAGSFFTFGESTSGSFSLAAPLGANLIDQFITPEQFSFSDGFEDLTIATTIISRFEVSTDASGNITNWNIAVEDINFNQIDTFNTGFGADDSGNVTVDDRFGFDAFIQNDPGAWSSNAPPPDPTSSPVPEPASLLLLGTGAIGVAGSVRRRFLS